MPALVSLAPEQSVFRSLLRSPASTPSLHIDPQTPTSNNANRNRVLTPTQASLSSFISTRRSQLDTPTSSKPVAPTEHSEFSESRHKVELPASSTDPLTVLGPLVAADLAGNPAGDIESWLQSYVFLVVHYSLLDLCFIYCDVVSGSLLHRIIDPFSFITLSASVNCFKRLLIYQNRTL
jgi:hypothetical protein